MENKWIKMIVVLVLSCFFLTGCEKNETKYFADAEDDGLTIFSNTDNNIFTCYVNGKPWRTINRTTGGLFSPSVSEMYLSKQIDSSLQNMLVIQWDGYLQDDPNDFNTITLYLAVPPNFTSSDIGSLQGKRLSIDTTNSYFIANISGFSNNYERGSGTVYFNRANFDSTGSLSGLLDANFSTFKITKGRFDHQLSFLQVRF